MAKKQQTVPHTVKQRSTWRATRRLRRRILLVGAGRGVACAWIGGPLILLSWRGRVVRWLSWLGRRRLVVRKLQSKPG